MTTNSQTSALTEFALARTAEARARYAATARDRGRLYLSSETPEFMVQHAEASEQLVRELAAARWRRCRARRRLRMIAYAYADHPDYRDEWRP